MFAIAEFPGPVSNEIAIIHTNWIHGKKCYWPPFWKNTNQLTQALKAGVSPDVTSWSLFEARVISGRYFETYEMARKKLPRATDGSELSAEENLNIQGNRKRVLTNRGQFEEDSDDSDGTNEKRAKVRPIFKKPKSRRRLEESFPLPQPPSLETHVPLSPPVSLIAVGEGHVNAEEIFTQAEIDSLTPAVPSVIVDESHDRERTPMINPSSSSYTWDSTNQPYFASNACASPLVHNSADVPQSEITYRSSLAQVLTNQSLILAKMDILMDCVRTILGTGLADKNKRQLDSDCHLKLPLTDLGEFNRLNQAIISNDQLKGEIVTILSTTGGNNVNQVTYRVMAALMSDELMTQFTFAGHTKKPSFKDSIFMAIVCERNKNHAVKSQPKGSVGNNKEIEGATEYWLKKASIRIAKKEKRLQEAHQGGQI